MSTGSGIALWAKATGKYFVHEETEAASQRARDQGFKPMWSLGLEGARKQVIQSSYKEREHCKEFTQYKGSVQDLKIPASHLPEGIEATVYTPEGVPEVPVLIVYFHGGGLVVADKKVYELNMMTLARNTDAIVVIPEFRSLPNPEDRLAPFTDCEAVTRWVLDNKTAVGGVASSPVGVVGDSAGGQLCCSISYSVPGRLAFQVLVYPVADIALEGVESMEDFWDTPGICGKDMEAMFQWCKLFEEPSYAGDPRVNPSAPRGVSGDASKDPPLSASPPTLVLLARLDPLRTWGEDYARKLHEARVPVQLRVVEGAPHVFFSRPDDYPSCAAEGHAIVREFVKSFQE